MTIGSTQRWNTVFSVLREQYRKRFFELLDSNESSKVLVWDPDLMQPFNLLTGFKELQERKVVQMLQLKTRVSLSSEAAHVFFIVRPIVALMPLVADLVLDASIGSLSKFHVLFVPQRSVVCEEKLKQLDALSILTSIHELPVFFFLWDKDVMSMERDDFLERVLVEEDEGLLYTVALAMAQLQKGFGKIRHFYCKGEHSRKVYQAMKSILSKEKQSDYATQLSPINSVVMLDRAIDLISPLVCQLTYEGLIDEIFGIKCATAKFLKAKFGKEQADVLDKESQSKSSSDSVGQSQSFVQTLNSSEELYDQLRNLNFNAIGNVLREKVKDVAEKIEVGNRATTVIEYKEFVKKLPALQAMRSSISVHTTIAEMVKEVTRSSHFLDTLRCEQEMLNCIGLENVHSFIEDCINRKENLFKVLRLLCLQYLVNGNMKPKVLNQYRKEILQSYGYTHMPLLLKLQAAGILSKATTTTNRSDVSGYRVLRKLFRQIVDDVDEKEPNDSSYVYSGYASLLVRLCEYWLKPGWHTINEHLAKIPGEIVIDESADESEF